VPEHHSLSLRDLSLQIHLGCSEQERARAQEVRVSIEFRFLNAPLGATSDKLQDTICYAEISQSLKDFCQNREFQLVEKLAADFYQMLRSHVDRTTKISLTVHKVAPPVEGLLGGTVYQIGDFH